MARKIESGPQDQTGPEFSEKYSVGGLSVKQERAEELDRTEAVRFFENKKAVQEPVRKRTLSVIRV